MDDQHTPTAPRILVAGAGATGGALAARLATAGRDVTLLVRERRAQQLAGTGLVLHSPDGDLVQEVPVVTDVAGQDPFDLVVVAVKAPGLEPVMETIAPAVGEATRILPLLNGMAHVDALQGRFGDRVLGGVIKIVATLDDTGGVLQMTPLFRLEVGELDGSPFPDVLANTLDVDGIDLDVVDDVTDRLWAKWAFIAAAGVTTCLFRGCVGDIMAAGGQRQVLAVIDECEQVAAAAGHPVSDQAHQMSVDLLTEPGSAFTSSLYRDLLHGDPQESEHIVGALSDRAAALGVATPLLDATALQLRTHHRATVRAAEESVSGR